MFDFDMKHPFSTFCTDPAYNGDLNGATVMIMQEHEDYDKAIEIIDLFYKYHPEDKIEYLDEIQNLLQLEGIDFVYMSSHWQKEIIHYVETLNSKRERKLIF